MKTLLAILLLFITLSVDAITLVWDPNPAGDMVTSYRIYRKQGNTFSVVKTVTAPTVSAVIDPYLSGRTTFYVTAVNLTGESVPSAQITVHK